VLLLGYTPKQLEYRTGGPRVQAARELDRLLDVYKPEQREFANCPRAHVGQSRYSL
jgi:hypothetical protein